jgi:integrase/recombinase XerD
MRNGSVVRVSGPLAAYADDFWGYLAGQGYAPSSSQDQLRLMAHVSGWLGQQGADAAGLTAERIAEFLVVRRGSHVRLVSGRALAPLLGFLRGLGVAPPEPEPVPCTTADRLADAYRRYLAGERGLAAGTVRLRERVARLFLGGLSEPVEEHLSRLDGAEVAAFVLRECPGRSVSAARTVVSGTRSLLRFFYLEGYLPRRLDAGVPGMAGWSMTALPRAVDPQLAARLIASRDPDTAAGRRDRAIVVLLARLGLRGQEVADLELDDIDWRAGEVVIRGKGHSRDRLPLPADVGEAVAGYLRHARPPSASRRLFLSARAPLAPLSASAVRSVVRDACRRAGLPRIGAHRLRHMTGTEMQERLQEHLSISMAGMRIDLPYCRALAEPAGRRLLAASDGQRDGLVTRMAAAASKEVAGRPVLWAPAMDPIGGAEANGTESAADSQPRAVSPGS